MRHGNSLERKLTRARTQLLLNQPFFGTLCLRLQLMTGAVPTMATDGRRIFYDPAFADSLTPAELEGVLAHEVLHCALGHHCRRGQCDPRLWNEAADLAINPMLVADKFTLPTGALIDPAYANLSAEEIYALLLQKTGTGVNSTPAQSPQPPSPGSDTASAQPGPSPATVCFQFGRPIGETGSWEFGRRQDRNYVLSAGCIRRGLGRQG